MKAKVVVAFNDKYTGKEHKAGDVIDLTAERFNEILRKGLFVKAYEAPARKTEVKEDKE